MTGGSDPESPRAPTRVVELALIHHGPGLERYVRAKLHRFGGIDIDAGDVVQDVCFECLRKAAAFPAGMSEDSTRRWLFTIAVRRIRFVARRRRASRQTAATDVGRDEALLSLLEEVAVYDRTPSQSAASRETRVAVQRSMAQLRPDYARVIQARYIDRTPTAQLAEQMGRNANALDQLCHRALKALRAELGTRFTHA